MIIKIIPLIILSIRISLIITPSPIILGLWIFLLALTVAIIISSLSSWLAIIIFLIYIGGLLVLFAYFLAIQPNQFTGITTLILFTITGVIFLISTIKTTTHWTTFNIILPIIPFIIHVSNTTSILLLASLLLLILVIVVKITSSKSGPLRPYKQHS